MAFDRDHFNKIFPNRTYEEIRSKVRRLGDPIRELRSQPYVGPIHVYHAVERLLELASYHMALGNDTKALRAKRATQSLVNEFFDSQDDWKAFLRTIERKDPLSLARAELRRSVRSEVAS